MGRFRLLIPIILTLAAQPAVTVRAETARRIVWKTSETNNSQTVQGTWTWDRENKRFLGRWTDGAVAHLRVKHLDKRQVILSRHDLKGTTPGLTARYVGSRDGKSFQGTVEWTWKGKVSRGTWKGRWLSETIALQVRLNKSRYPAERKLLQSPTERRAFPSLGSHFEILAPHTKTYNCIAWSVGITNHWLWPKKDSVAGFDRLYGLHGYKRIPTLDYHLVPGAPKIVLYARSTKSGRLKCTHGARQNSDGTWTSKLGKLPLIRHLTPQALIGPSYGRPVAVYVKQ